MRTSTRTWTPAAGWSKGTGEALPDADLLLYFGSTDALERPDVIARLRAAHPRALALGCSTAGEIDGTRVSDGTVVAVAVAFQGTQVRGTDLDLPSSGDGLEAGRALARRLAAPDLVHVFVLSDGLHVNGSALVEGLSDTLPAEVAVTGGLSGDGERFRRTLVGLGERVGERRVAAVGFYGSRLRVGYGSLGGWDPFGPERLVTRSKGNVLYEMDGKSALDLYKKYLGEQAKGLPATGLLFPLSLRTRAGETGVVRTILAVDEAEKSMTFAGDVPEGSYARMMKANFDRLIDGAIGAARAAHGVGEAGRDALAILVSCVGRKLVLRQRVEEEVEGVRDVLGPSAVLTGFYSYGEISPFTPHAKCELHNQTMTITTLGEGP